MSAIESFPRIPFRLCQIRFGRRPGAVKGAQYFARRSGPFTAEDQPLFWGEPAPAFPRRGKRERGRSKFLAPQANRP
jgi:hypothetical protein